jgi:hypothetical protein
LFANSVQFVKNRLFLRHRSDHSKTQRAYKSTPGPNQIIFAVEHGLVKPHAVRYQSQYARPHRARCFPAAMLHRKAQQAGKVSHLAS